MLLIALALNDLLFSGDKNDQGKTLVGGWDRRAEGFRPSLRAGRPEGISSGHSAIAQEESRRVSGRFLFGLARIADGFAWL